MKKIYLLLCLSIVTLHAQDGTMDNTFNYNGSNGISIGPLTDYGDICHLQASGKLIAGGEVKDAYRVGYTKMGLARFDNDGLIDRTFGTNGVVLLYPNSFDHFIAQIENDPAGNLFVLGTYGSRYCVAKLTIDGIVDTTFGTNGFVIEQSFEVSKMALLDDGKFLLYGTGWIGNTRSAGIKRYLANGTLDTTFGVNGLLKINIGSADNFSGRIFVQPDGKIVATGSYEYVENAVTLKKLFLTRLMPDTGATDTSYGVNGFNTSTEMIGFRYAKMKSDGTITVLGYRLSPTAEANSVRATFDANGNIIADRTLYFYANGRCITMQPDGKILYAGSYIDAVEANGANCFFVRLDANGNYDPTFGNQGMLRKAFSAGNEDILDIEVGADGKIYFSGYSMLADFDFLVGRINSGLVVLETENFEASDTFTVSPNPVGNVLEISSKSQIRESRIFDIQGRLVQTSNGLKTIDVSGLPSGMYILSAVSNDNIVSRTKFVKK